MTDQASTDEPEPWPRSLPERTGADVMVFHPSGSGKTIVIIDGLDGIHTAGGFRYAWPQRTVTTEMPAAPTAPADFERFAAAARPRLIKVVSALLARFGSDLAEDIVQTALVTVWRRWTKSGAPDNPHAFAATVAIRLAGRYVRTHDRLRTTPIPDDGQLSASPAASEIEAVPLRVDLHRAFRRLSPRQRAIMRQHLAGKTNQEIAQFFKISPGTVGAQLHTARKILRAHLNGQLGRRP